MKSKKTYAQLAKDFKLTKSDKSFEALYNRIKPSLRTYIMTMVKDYDVCEDLLSRTCIKIYEKIDTYDAQFAITTWAYTIAKRECLRWIKRERNPRVSLTYLMENGSQAMEGGTDSVKISHAGIDFEAPEYKTIDAFEEEDSNLDATYNLAVNEIKELKPLYRDILIDNLFNEMKYREIAYKYDEGLREVQDKLEKLQAVLPKSNKQVKDAQREYNIYYKQSLQRIKNRIRRGKQLVSSAIKEKHPNYTY